MNVLDCRGKNCPMPLVETKKMLETMGEGTLRTIIDNETAKENISKFARSMGYAINVSEDQGNFVVEITKGETPQTVPSTITPNSGENSGLVVMISKDFMGAGSEELGRILIKGYLYALTEVEPLPKTLLFVNSGVKLTCQGSESLDTLRKLEQQGVEIVSCGTCLDYFQLKSQLLIGAVGNMYSIVEQMNRAANAYTL